MPRPLEPRAADNAPAGHPAHEASRVGGERADVRLPRAPLGPSESAYSESPIRAPASRAIARSMSGFTELSGNTASTPSRRICSTSRSTSPADACACVESDGITAPTTSTP